MGPALLHGLGVVDGEFQPGGQRQHRKAHHHTVVVVAMEQELRAVGGVLESEGGTITVQGCTGKLHAPAAPLHGHNDHRVVMSLAVLSAAAGLPLTVDDAEAITKSWPNFFEAIKPLGAEVEYAG